MMKRGGRGLEVNFLDGRMYNLHFIGCREPINFFSVHLSWKQNKKKCLNYLKTLFSHSLLHLFSFFRRKTGRWDFRRPSGKSGAAERKIREQCVLSEERE